MRKYSKKLDYQTEDLESLSISELKKLADYWLRQYLLRREGDVTYYSCPLKQKLYTKEYMEVAHYIDRQCMNTRYDLTNCHLISKQSNTWDAQIPKEGYKSKHHYDYENYLGDVIVKDLKERGKEIKTFRREDYIEVIEKFKNE